MVFLLYFLILKGNVISFKLLPILLQLKHAILDYIFSKNKVLNFIFRNDFIRLIFAVLDDIGAFSWDFLLSDRLNFKVLLNLLFLIWMDLLLGTTFFCYIALLLIVMVPTWSRTILIWNPDLEGKKGNFSFSFSFKNFLFFGGGKEKGNFILGKNPRGKELFFFSYQKKYVGGGCFYESYHIRPQGGHCFLLL